MNGKNKRPNRISKPAPGQVTVLQGEKELFELPIAISLEWMNTPP